MRKIIPILMIVAGILAGCNSKENKKTVEKKQIIYVKAAKSLMINYVPELKLSGSVKPWKEANLGTIIPGKVEKILVKEGQFVKKGDLLVELSAELLTQSEIEYKTYQKDYNRVKTLFKEGSISEMDYDHIKAKYEASYEKYKLLKKNCQIFAPFSGIITDKLLNEGETFTFNLPLKPGYSHNPGIVKLMQYNKVKIAVEVDENQLKNIHKNQKVKVKLSAFPNDLFSGKVYEIKQYVSNMTRTSTVYIKVDNSDRKIKPGMFAEVAFILGEKSGVKVPRSGILQQEGTGNYYVLNIDSTQNSGIAKAKRVDIKIVYNENDFAVVKGLAENKLIVTAGKSKVISGNPINFKLGD